MSRPVCFPGIVAALALLWGALPLHAGYVGRTPSVPDPGNGRVLGNTAIGVPAQASLFHNDNGIGDGPVNSEGRQAPGKFPGTALSLRVNDHGGNPAFFAGPADESIEGSGGNHATISPAGDPNEPSGPVGNSGDNGPPNKGTANSNPPPSGTGGSSGGDSLKPDTLPDRPSGPPVLFSDPPSGNGPGTTFSPNTPGQPHSGPTPGLPGDEDPDGPTIPPATPTDLVTAGPAPLPVPEPASAALALTALGLVGLARRFRA